MTGRLEWPLAPVRGRALLFSSGWENVHYVAPALSGERFAIATFWTTEILPRATAGRIWRSSPRA